MHLAPVRSEVLDLEHLEKNISYLRGENDILLRGEALPSYCSVAEGVSGVCKWDGYGKHYSEQFVKKTDVAQL